MGLDMYIFKVRKLIGATLNDAMVVDSYQGYKEDKKENPKYHGSMKNWCG